MLLHNAICYKNNQHAIDLTGHKINSFREMNGKFIEEDSKIANINHYTTKTLEEYLTIKQANIKNLINSKGNKNKKLFDLKEKYTWINNGNNRVHEIKETFEIQKYSKTIQENIKKRCKDYPHLLNQALGNSLFSDENILKMYQN